MYDWNELKAFLAVARNGSTLAAAKTLNVNQTTVARRLESLEAALQLRLFERGQAGSRLTEAGRDLLAEAEKVERAATGLANRAQAHQRGLAGAIRIRAFIDFVIPHLRQNVRALEARRRAPAAGD